MTQLDLSQPILLRPDNFTPLSRTPWAGQDIGRLIKADAVPGAGQQAIGETWEFSLGPEFPSRTIASGESIHDLFRKHPDAFWQGHTRPYEILVKILNASEPLSIQVHPDDNDPDLGSAECGKPEAWLVLHAAKDAMIYLGFSRNISPDELRDAIQANGNVQSLLQPVKVKPGDYFELGPGVPHSLGPGIVVLEPQRVLEGKAGKTYRLWDFNRRYDDAGRKSPNGKPRPLHLSEGLKLVHPERQWGEEFVESLRRSPQIEEKDGLIVSSYPANSYCQVTLVRQSTGGARPLTVTRADAPLILTVLAGRVATANGQHVSKGYTAVVAARAAPLELRLAPASELAIIHPPESAVLS